jgi:hypothetical protein
MIILRRSFCEEHPRPGQFDDSRYRIRARLASERKRVIRSMIIDMDAISDITIPGRVVLPVAGVLFAGALRPSGARNHRHVRYRHA